jgi:hypothetical protein
MSKDMMPKRWSVGNYDGYMVERDGGDYVEAEDVEPLVAEITRLREQLHLANIDAVGAHAEANEFRKHLIKAVALIIRLIDTRRCSAADLRTLNAARAALEAKP